MMSQKTREKKGEIQNQTPTILATTTATLHRMATEVQPFPTINTEPISIHIDTYTTEEDDSDE